MNPRQIAPAGAAPRAASLCRLRIKIVEETVERPLAPRDLAVRVRSELDGLRKLPLRHQTPRVLAGVDPAVELLQLLPGHKPIIDDVHRQSPVTGLTRGNPMRLS